MPTRFLFAVLVALILVACSPRTSVRSLPVPTADPNATTDWRRDWLRGKPCAPPCFMGITPGTMSQTQTLDLLRAATPAVLPEIASKSGRSQASINWLIETADPESQASALFFQTPVERYNLPLNTIVTIRLGASGVLSLGEVMEAYGDPSHVLALAEPSADERTVFWLSLVYIPQGFNLSMWFDYDGRQPVFTPSTPVERVHFFVSTVGGYDQAMGPLNGFPHPSELMVPWAGFEGFSYYCREAPQPNNPDRRGCP